MIVELGTQVAKFGLQLWTVYIAARQRDPSVESSLQQINKGLTTALGDCVDRRNVCESDLAQLSNRWSCLSWIITAILICVFGCILGWKAGSKNERTRLLRSAPQLSELAGQRIQSLGDRSNSGSGSDTRSSPAGKKNKSLPPP